MTQPADIAAIFDRSSASYEQVGPAFFAPMGAELVARAGLADGFAVLDVGCGRGHCLFPAAAVVGPAGSVLGIDLAPGMVAATAAEARSRGLTQVRVEAGDASAADFAPASFDAVLAGLVIFFLPDPAVALRAWADLLKPGGRLTMTTFGKQEPGYDRAMKAIVSFVAQKPGELKIERPAEKLRAVDSVRALVEANGFREVSIEEVSFETRFTGPEQWWEWVLSHGGRSIIEKLPEDRVAEARAAAFAELEALRTAEGDLAIRTGVRYTTAMV
jgi:ubiquinone/menaquinone biosynthesis C-methylase UbiE